MGKYYVFRIYLTKQESPVSAVIHQFNKVNREIQVIIVAFHCIVGFDIKPEYS